MFRPSRGHLQADIRTILESIQIMCGREISLLKCFCYKSDLYTQGDQKVPVHLMITIQSSGAQITLYN